MTIETTSYLDSAITTRYNAAYQKAARIKRLYDQLAIPFTASQFDLEKRRGMGSTYTYNFHADMTPGTTAVSETSDIIPQVVIDATATVTPTSRGEAIKWSELLDLQAYTNWIESRAEMVGDNAMESIEVLAYTAALGGSLVIRYTDRASLDAGTTTHNWNEAALWGAAAMCQGLRCPPFVDKGRAMFVAIAHPDAYYDLFHSGNILSAATYGGLPGSTLLNGELGEIANFKLVISPWAKVFGGAGTDNSTGSSQTYLLSANSDALATSLSITTGTNVAYGRLITIGTEETSTTFYPQNERVRRVSGTTTMTLVGSGANGGTRFAHTTADYALNADSVYPVVYGVPGSLVHVYAKEIGPMGKMVGPLTDGVAEQWQSLAWKYYGGYGRISENYLLRGEYSSSLDS